MKSSIDSKCRAPGGKILVCPKLSTASQLSIASTGNYELIAGLQWTATEHARCVFGAAEQWTRRVHRLIVCARANRAAIYICCLPLKIVFNVAGPI